MPITEKTARRLQSAAAALFSAEADLRAPHTDEETIAAAERYVAARRAHQEVAATADAEAGPPS